MNTYPKFLYYTYTKTIYIEFSKGGILVADIMLKLHVHAVLRKCQKPASIVNWCKEGRHSPHRIPEAQHRPTLVFLVWNHCSLLLSSMGND